MRGEGRVFKRGRVWWIAYCGPGERGAVEIRESSRSDNETAARKLLRDRVREVANHRNGVRVFSGPRAERLTVADLLDALKDDYQRRAVKSLRTSLSHIKPLREFFGPVRAVAVTPALIGAYVAERMADGKSNATINRETEILATAFNLALKQDRLPRRPYIPRLPENNARRGFFEAEEHARMLARLVSPFDDIARFAYISGWRSEEIRSLRWGNVDRSAKEVRIHDSKNGEGRILPLEGELWEVFERRWEARRYETKRGPGLAEHVFHVAGRAVGEVRFNRAWRAARKAAGLPEKLFHDYRRTAARDMIRAGVSQTVAMSITGHKTESMFRRYNIVTTEDKRAAIKSVEDHHSDNSSDKGR